MLKKSYLADIEYLNLSKSKIQMVQHHLPPFDELSLSMSPIPMLGLFTEYRPQTMVQNPDFVELFLELPSFASFGVGIRCLIFCLLRLHLFIYYSSQSKNSPRKIPDDWESSETKF